MSKIVLYHGSTRVIKVPKINLGNINNDYGQGFYCTKDIDLAREWACKNGGNCFVNSYYLDLDKLKILDLTSDDYSVLHWITVLLENRRFALYSDIMQVSVEYLITNYHLDLSLYDVVIGYRADDSYFSYARDFISNALSIESLNKSILLGNLGTQYFIRSKKGFDNISFIDYEEVDFKYYHSKCILREKSARTDYEQIRHTEGFRGTFISNIIERGYLK